MTGEILTGPRDGSSWREWEEGLNRMSKQEIIDSLRTAIQNRKLLPPLFGEKPYTHLDAVSKGNAGHIGFTHNWP